MLDSLTLSENKKPSEVNLENPEPLPRSDMVSKSGLVKRKLDEEIDRKREEIKEPPVKRRAILSNEPKIEIPNDHCPFCRGLKKLSSCPNIEHFDGKIIEREIKTAPIKRKAIVAEIDESEVIKRQKGDESKMNPRQPVDDMRSSDNRYDHNKRLEVRRDQALNSGPQRMKPYICTYCKSLVKRPNCMNNQHKDGQPIDPSFRPQVHVPTTEFGQRLCPLCNSLRKRCGDPNHIDGHYYRTAKSTTPTSSSSRLPTFESLVNRGGNLTKNSSTEVEEKFNQQRLKLGEEKEKQKYYLHHKPAESTISADALAAQLVPLGPQNKKPLERLKESRRNQPGVFRDLNIQKFEPLDKTAIPWKSSLKSASKDYSQVIEEETKASRPRTKKIFFADEKDKPLDQVIPFQVQSPENP